MSTTDGLHLDKLGTCEKTGKVLSLSDVRQRRNGAQADDGAEGIQATSTVKRVWAKKKEDAVRSPRRIPNH